MRETKIPASKLKPFTCSYLIDGQIYDVTVFAADREDCAQRMRAIGMNGAVDGEQVFEAIIPEPEEGSEAVAGGRIVH